MKGLRCLVTGAAGFIGSHLCRRLANDGAQVHALVRPGGSKRRLIGLADRISIHQATLEDKAAMLQILAAARPQFVFHLATPTRGGIEPGVNTAREAIDSIVKPLLGFVGMLAELPDAPANFVRAGTIAEYGRSTLPFREDRREAPSTPYGAAMLAGTQQLSMLEGVLPFPAITARMALTYGPDQDTSFLVPAMIAACERNEPFTLRRPNDRRDLIHVDDVVEALVRLGARPLDGIGHVNIGTGVAPSMAEVASLIVEATQRKPDLIIREDRQSTGLPSELRCDISMASRIYGWEPEIPVQAGLQKVVDDRSTLFEAAGERHG